MNQYVCKDMIECNPKPRIIDDLSDLIFLLFDCSKKTRTKNKNKEAEEINISLLSLFLLQEEQLKSRYEDTYYFYDLEKDKYIMLYMEWIDVELEIKNINIFYINHSNTLKFINNIKQFDQDPGISEKIKKDAYISLLRDIEWDLGLVKFPIQNYENIKKGIQKGTPISKIMVHIKFNDTHNK